MTVIGEPFTGVLPLVITGCILHIGRAPFEPYGGVTRQMFAILRAVNRVRKTAGLSMVPRDCIRVRRQVVRPFDDSQFRRISVLNDDQFPLAA